MITGDFRMFSRLGSRSNLQNFISLPFLLIFDKSCPTFTVLYVHYYYVRKIQKSHLANDVGPLSSTLVQHWKCNGPVPALVCLTYFDTVYHSILFNKLNKFGVRDSSYEWLKSYLSNKNIFVAFESTVSSKSSITCGNPQGSFLGPLPFYYMQTI